MDRAAWAAWAKVPALRLQALVATASALLVLGLVATAPATAAPAWLAPLDLSKAGHHATSPQVAVDPQGNATAVWQRENGSNWIIQSSEHPAGGAWSEPPDNLSEIGQDAGLPQVAVDPQGNATAVWQRSDGANYIVQSASRPAGGAWSAPLDLSAAGHSAFYPQVAVDPQGNATAVWQRSDGSNEIIQSSERPAGGVWSEPPDNLSEIGQDAAFPQVAVDPQGNATAVWNRGSPGNEVVQSSERPAGGAWSEPLDLSTAAAGLAQVAIDQQGNATAVWGHWDGEDWIIQSSGRPAGGAWSEPLDLSAAGHSAFYPQVAVDPQGNAAAVWFRTDGSNSIIQSSGRPAGGAWSAPLDLSAAEQYARAPQVAIDPQGNAAAVWYRSDGANYIVQAAGYDATPPQLRDLSIPATGTAGQPVAFSVSPFDVWSAGPTGWSFGDGASAGGTAVSHAYAVAGTYQVTVTSADAAGNASNASGSIAIAPAAPGRGTAFAARLARVKGGRALLRLRCRGGPCRGVVRLLARRKLIGKARFSIAAGKAKAIRVKLNRKGKRLLRRTRRHRLEVKLGGRGVWPRTVLLKQVQRQRRNLSSLPIRTSSRRSPTFRCDRVANTLRRSNRNRASLPRANSPGDGRLHGASLSFAAAAHLGLPSDPPSRKLAGQSSSRRAARSIPGRALASSMLDSPC
jgi:hypothetical protein